MASDDGLGWQGKEWLDNLLSTESREPIPGLWESFLDGLITAGEDQGFSYLQKYVVDLERSETKALKKFYRDDFVGAFAEVKRCEPLSAALWPDLGNAFSVATSKKELTAVRWSVGLELLLSVLVAWEIDEADTFGDISLESVLPRDQRNPTAQFFQWILHQTGFSTVPELCDELASHGVNVEESTLERWKGGWHQPAIETVEEVSALFQYDSRKRKLMVLLANASRFLNFMGYASNSLTDARDQMESKNPELCVLFPGLPFGYRDFESWVWGRYAIWREIHRARHPRS